MKKILSFLAAVACTAALAEPIGYIRNEAGGKIVFTNDTCYDSRAKKDFPGLFNVYGYSSSGGSIRGCFVYEKKAALLRVVWEDRSESVFDIDLFNVYGNGE